MRTVDTDVVIILVGKFFYFTRLDSAADIWVAFGVVKILLSGTYSLLARKNKNKRDQKLKRLFAAHNGAGSGCPVNRFRAI